MHAKQAVGLKAIEVNYDGSGVTRAKKFENNSNEMHKWIYFNGEIMFAAINTITLFSLLLLTLFTIFRTNEISKNNYFIERLQEIKKEKEYTIIKVGKKPLVLNKTK